MKRFYLFTVLCLAMLPAFSQDFPGYRAGNYTGVNGVFFNPANIADSRYRFDFNLFSMNSAVGNNNASFNAKNTVQSFDPDSLHIQIFGKHAGSSSGMVSLDAHGPSLMFNAGKKLAFALTTRGRVMSNIVDIDGRLIDKIINDFNNSTDLPYTISSENNMRMNVNAWAEYGLSVGAVLADQDMHFFKAGATVKYLAGVGNGYVKIDNLNANLQFDAATNEPYLSNSTGSLALGFGGINVKNFSSTDLTQIESSGFGADLGFIYEFRPEYENYRLETDTWRRDMNKYKMRIGVALLDIGGISYDLDAKRSGAYALDIKGSERFYLDKLATANPDDFKDTLNSLPQLFIPEHGNERSYFASLPTSLHVDVDYHLSRGFYLNIATQLALSDSKNKTYNSHYYHAFSVTPRFEGRTVGIYVPVNYNTLTSFNAGLSVRLGPIFVGSGSVINALFGESKQADVHFGLRLGGLQKNKAKEYRKDKELQDDYRRSQGRRM